MTKLSKLEVPLIQEDLKYPETIVQIANTLDILDQVIRNVFDHVNKRIGSTRESLLNIQERNNAVSAKIEQLRSIQKSVTITSKNKYPYEDSRNFGVDFVPQPKLVFDKLPPAVVSARDPPSVDLDSKLKFYHVKSADSLLHKNTDLVCEESLGSLPPHIDSITSCLLFNTSENVYEKYVIVDPLSAGPGVKTAVLQDNAIIKMEDAPKSLQQDDDLLHRKQEFVYSPSVEQAPVIELPADLPDLMGFADDFRYTGENLVDTTITTPAPPKLVPQADPPIPSRDPTPQPSVPTQPPPVPSGTAQPISTRETTPPQAPANTAPPPPPPPPVEAPAPSATPEPSSLHANLMQAIRSAGGKDKAKLRSVDQEASAPTAKPSGGTAAPPAGDLMSDLAAKLQLRRKGISGTNDGGGPVGGLMDRLLLTLPPPPPRGAESSGSEETTEGEDAEWED